MTSSGRAVCLQCGTQITPRAGRLYCGARCRQAAHRGQVSIEARVWEGTAIQRRRGDGYVNATAMCQANGKRWENYRRNERTQEYIAALAETLCGAAVARFRATGIGALIETRQGGRPELQGTWIHPRLAVDLARWISPAFAVWMDGWFLEAAPQGQQQAPRTAPRFAPAGRAQPQVGTGERILAACADIDLEKFEQDGDVNHLVAAHAMATLLSHRLSAELLKTGRLPTWFPKR